MKHKLDPKKFVTIWQKAENTDEVVRQTGLKRTTAIQMAAQYRKRDVPLKLMRKGPNKRDWDMLANLAKRFNTPAHVN